MMRRAVALVLLLMVAGPSWAGAEYPARVVGISDGDTLTVLRTDQSQVKIRLAGVDAPETGQDFGSKARQATADLAFGKDVTVHSTGTDRYGWTVADVVLPGGRSLNRELVKSGLAWCYRKFAPADGELARLEGEARTARRGLWSQPGAVAPWDWRHGRGVPVVAAVVGNRRSHVYHAPHCRSVASMKAENRVEFSTARDAEAKGYQRAGDCD